MEPAGHSNTTWCLQDPPLQHNFESPVFTAISLAVFDSLAVTQNPQPLVSKILRQETSVLGKQRGTRAKQDSIPDQLGLDLCHAL